MKGFHYFLLLSLILAIHNCADKGLCNGQLSVFKVDHSIPTIKIETDDSRDQIISKFKAVFEEDLCYKEIVFGWQLSEAVVKTHFTLYCPIKTSRIPPLPELRILVNDQGQALVNFEKTILLDSLDQWILKNMPLAIKHHDPIQEISIIWNEYTTANSLELATLEVMNGFQLKFDQIAHEKFGQPYCKLDNEQSAVVEQAFPYKFVLNIGLPPPPPPPPTKKNN